MAPQVGSDFGGFRIDAEIGRGGMGVVYRAWQHRLGRPVAVKVLATDAATEPGYRERFAREAAALARLDSPHVIQIYDHGEVDGNLYLAMQLVSGPDLATVLASGPLPPRRALGIVAQIAAALADAQAVDVVHRDVKPGNVLLRQRAEHDDEDFAYLCDFGIARSATEATGPTGTDGIVGTPAFLAPERLNGAAASGASDVYALGCLLWTALTGEQPYRGTQAQVLYAHMEARVPQLVDDGPRTVAVNALVADMMAKDPAVRPDARQVRERIRAVLDGRAAGTGQAWAGPAVATVTGTGAPVVGGRGPSEVPNPAPGPRGPAAGPPDRAGSGGRAAVPGGSGGRSDGTGGGHVADARPRSRRTVLLGGLAALVVAGAVAGGVALTSGPPAEDRLAAATPLGVAGCRPVEPGPEGGQARLVCPVQGAGELRITALSSAGAAEDQLAVVAGRDPGLLRPGACPQDLPARQSWQRGTHAGTMLCLTTGTSTRYAWSDSSTATVSVVDGAPGVAYPADLEAVSDFVSDLRFG